MINVQDLTRIYTRKLSNGWFRPATRLDHIAVDHLSFHITPGERVAFIGPNGAGKTTTLRMLTGLLYPTSGMAQVAGYIPWKDRKKLAREIGIVFGQRSQLWAALPVIESFHSLRVIYDVPKAAFTARLDDLAQRLAIEDFLHQPARSLSLGQRMRCEIAAALIHGPKVLFLDEPTIGLDVEAKAVLRDYLKTLNTANGTTIILTSHDTGDIEDICERVIMIDHGRKLMDQPLQQLLQSFDTGRRIVITTEEKDPPCAGLEDMLAERAPHRLTLNVDAQTIKLTQAMALVQSQATITDIVIERTPLETIIRRLYAQNGKETS